MIANQMNPNPSPKLNLKNIFIALWMIGALVVGWKYVTKPEPQPVTQSSRPIEVEVKTPYHYDPSKGYKTYKDYQAQQNDMLGLDPLYE